MKVATWNVNGIRAREAQLLEWLEREQPDVLCLQETKAALEQVPMPLRVLPGYRAAWHGERAYCGVALLLRTARFGEHVEVEHPPFDFEQRAITALAGDVRFACVYVPNGGKDLDAKMRFLDGMERYVAEELAAGRQLVLAGDLNVTRSDRDVHPKERKPGAIGQRPDERERLERLLGHGLVDVARALHPEAEDFFTWWAPWRNLRQRNIGWRIDYLLASAPLASRATECVSQREVGTSDHAPLVVRFAD